MLEMRSERCYFLYKDPVSATIREFFSLLILELEKWSKIFNMLKFTILGYKITFFKE